MSINNAIIRSNSELRSISKNQLKGKWGITVLLCFIFSIVSGALSAIPYLGIITGIILTGPLTLGLTSCFIRLVRNEHFEIEDLFEGFYNLRASAITQILIGLYTFLWTLFLVVPGIIAAYNYALAYYILSDNPKMKPSDVLRLSKKMMKGYKWKLFSLHLSFIGWALLSVLTLGIGFLWLVPYIYAATANFYENIKESYVEKDVAESTLKTVLDK